MNSYKETTNRGAEIKSLLPPEVISKFSQYYGKEPKSQEEIEEIFSDLSREQKIEIIDEHPCEYILDFFVHDCNPKIRVLVAQYGSTKHHDILVNDESHKVKGLVAVYGRNKHRDILVHENELSVIKMVARYGNYRNHELLSPHANQNVMIEILENGDNKYVDYFASHWNPLYRKMVIRYTGEEQHNRLLKDFNSGVRNGMAFYANKKQIKSFTDERVASVKENAYFYVESKYFMNLNEYH